MADMYFIAILLPQELNTKVLIYKEWMRDKYNCKVALKSPAHITLIPPFWLDDQKEERLVEATKRIATDQPKFNIQTFGFDAFQPRTLFIAVSPNELLNDLKKNAETIFASYPDLKIKKESRPFHPHVTIATRDLPKSAFYEAWDYFEEMEFRKEWIVEGLSVLKHNKKNWDVLHTSQFL